MTFRSVFLLVLLLALVAATVLGPRRLMPDQALTETEESCDPLTRSCDWSDSDGDWKVSLQRQHSEGTARQLRLEVKATAAVSGLTAILRGETMYLGEYPVPLTPGDTAGVWQANFTVPVCTLDDRMLWRIDLYHGPTPGVALSPLAKMVFEDPKKS